LEGRTSGAGVGSVEIGDRALLCTAAGTGAADEAAGGSSASAAELRVVAGAASAGAA
jgi:hypothetical protein